MDLSCLALHSGLVLSPVDVSDVSDQRTLQRTLEDTAGVGDAQEVADVSREDCPKGKISLCGSRGRIASL